ncbi:type II toxin-antitoxin system HipA family toxin [Pseudomaricurvus alkylphenolicus]|uniref:type II toxin-antitoxin system HipA family toxin n=1 Tax=Pseudomaricurvus alkylphenolicus TaxID=1306991 RepID=UPI0014233B50|nr:HipA domain-containing protein [Pseudomaricurvus alkylphenolicus]NIB40773.1 type II toxin-antitoxin system HipA family toxin [Pseudomaricurvus alkylphenolicus]
MRHLTLQTYRNGQWTDAAQIGFSNAEEGHRSPSRLDYDYAYVVQELGSDCVGGAVVSCRYPVDFSSHSSDHWPAFLLDILPGGEGRRRWAERLNVETGLSGEFALLQHATANPPGNLRIKEAVDSPFREAGSLPNAEGQLVPRADHPGFSQQDIVSKQENFIEYAYQQGAAVAGATDVQGEAPKFLLVQDLEGRWHAEGALSDEQVSKHWIVKFPRGSTAADREVLINEASYLEVARRCNLYVGEPLCRKGNALFIPRFDRLVQGGTVTRQGMESLYSIAGVSEFGAAKTHEFLCTELLNYLPRRTCFKNIVEYLKRDVLNVALGNTDNHGRNTAVLRNETGEIALSPLFDFAPMYLDPEGIARVTRWEPSREQAGRPIWAKVCEFFEPWLEAKSLKDEMRAFGEELSQLPDYMSAAGVDASIIERRRTAIENNILSLSEC